MPGTMDITGTKISTEKPAVKPKVIVKPVK